MKLREQLEYVRGRYIRERDKIFTPDRKHALRRAAAFARTGVIFLATAGAMGSAAGITYDVIAHNNGERGLTQGFAWGAVSFDSCIHVGYVAAHQVLPDENVSLSVRPFVADRYGAGVQFDLSGKAIEAGSRTFCYEDNELADAGVLFEAVNGYVHGSPDAYLYNAP